MASFAATTRALVPSKSLVNPTTEAQFLGTDGNALILPFEGSNILKNRRFRISIAGYGTSTGANNLVITVYYGISATPASNSSIMASGNIAMNSTNQNFCMDINVMYDTQSGTLGGFFQGQGANAVIALTALAHASAVASAATEGLGFTITATAAGVGSYVITTFELIPD